MRNLAGALRSIMLAQISTRDRVRATSLISLVLLIACGATSSSVGQTSPSVITATDSPLADDQQSRGYFPLSNYRKYPKNVRSLIRRTEIEDDRCRGRFDSETYLACNQRYYLLLALEKKGWCWGGGDYGYQEHWIRCRDDPHYEPGQYGSKPPFSDADIEEAASHQKHK